MGASVEPTSSAYERYKALRREGRSPEDASAAVASEFPSLGEDTPEVKATVTAGPITPVQDVDPDTLTLPTVTATVPNRPLRGLLGRRAPADAPRLAPRDATALRPATRPAPRQEMTVRAAPEEQGPSIGAAPERSPLDAPVPEATLKDKFLAWRERNMDETLAAFDPKQIDTERGRASMANILFGLTEAPRKVTGSLLGALGKRAVTAEEMLNIGKQRAADLERAIAPKAAPDLLPALEREGRMFGDTVAVRGARAVAGVGDQPKFPDLRTGPAVPSDAPAFPSAPKRAAGTITEGHPLFAGERPRMFKEGDFDLSPEGRTQLEGILGPTGRKQVVTWKEAEALADEIGTDPARILRNVRDLSGEEILAVKQAIATDTERVVALSKIVDDPAVTMEAKSAAMAEIDRRSRDLAAYASRVTRETSQTGRDLNLMKVMAKNTMEPSVWLVQASRMKGLPLNPEEVAQITKLASQRDREGLFQALSGLKTLGPLDKALTTWKAGLLTNPLTHLVNVGGNTVMAIMEQGKDAPAAVVDLMLSLGTGTRTKAFPRPGQVGASIKGAVTNGYAAAKQVLRTGATPEDLAKWDFRNGRFGKTLGSEKVGAVLDLYTQSVFRSLGAEDQIFKAAAVGRSLDEQIRVEAMNIAKRTKGSRAPITVKEAAAMLRANIPDAMQAQAIADAELATFQSDNLISGAVSAGKRYLTSKGPVGEAARGVVDVNLPFVRTPTNVLERTLDYTPAGLLRAIAPAWKMAKGRDMAASQRQIAEAFGRASVGSLAIWLGYEMAGNDMATGTVPLGAKDEWDVRGRIGGAVRTSPEGDWHQTVRMQPFGTLIALGAQLRTIQDNAQSASDVAGGSAAAVGKLVADQPFLQGVQNITEAVSDPESKGGRWVRSTAASVVPAAVSAVARGTDPYQRDAQTMGEAIKARIPGLSRDVPAKLSVLGAPLPSTGGVARQMFDLTRTSPNRETPVLKEARRLGVNLTRPSRTITVAGKTYTLSPEEYRLVQQQVGPEVLRRLEAAFNVPGYRKERKTPERTDLAQRERLEDAIRTAKSTVAKQLSREIYQAEKQGTTHVGTLRPRRPKF